MELNLCKTQYHKQPNEDYDLNKTYNSDLLSFKTAAGVIVTVPNEGRPSDLCENYKITVSQLEVSSDIEEEESIINYSQQIANEEPGHKKFLFFSQEINESSHDKPTPSGSCSFLYTKTDAENQMSSIFDSFHWKETLMKSLPHSCNDSNSVSRKSFDSHDPCCALERLDLEVENWKYLDLDGKALGNLDSIENINLATAFETFAYTGNLGKDDEPTQINEEKPTAICDCTVCSVF